MTAHSTAATRLEVHQDHHDDRRKDGNASKGGLGGTESLSGGSVRLSAVSSRSLTGTTSTTGSSRNSSVPKEVGRADREGSSGTIRETSLSFVSFSFGGGSDSKSDASLVGVFP